jgi:hypothetical protein
MGYLFGQKRDDAKVILGGLERSLPGARCQIGPPHRYL